MRQVRRHPLGKDIIATLLRQLGRSPRWVANPLVDALPLGLLHRLLRRRVGENFVPTLITLLNQHRERPPVAVGPVGEEWWRSAVFYQIYPRSFMDSNGDGIGDLRGILEKLDYLQNLGVDALWLSPIYDSPNDDNGYDIRDYRAIMAEFGTMADFDELVAALHARGMRLVMDLVVNHTSDEHPWFQAALADADSPYRDYYFFRPGEPDAPPNNWTSFFSGSAWRWFPAQARWVLHLFSAKQMDLNWAHPPVRREVTDLVRWWLEKGVDGFRLDVINYISKPPALPAGDETVGALMQYTGVEHYFAGPRLHEHLRELRAEAFAPYGAVTIGETPGVGAELGALLTAPSRGELDMIFSFDHLETPGHTRFDDYRYDLGYLREHWTAWQTGYGAAAWPTLFFDNHDNPRMVSKVDPRPAHRVAVAKLLAVLQLTLRGTPFLYQGQELGLVNQRFTGIDQLRDVESLNRYAALRAAGATEEAAFAEVLAGSRDHTRTGMPWTGAAHGGFTTGIPWIIGDDDFVQHNAQAQESDAASVLHAHRALIALRRRYPALTRGEIAFRRSRRALWVYEREHAGERIRIVANLTDRTQKRPSGMTGDLLYASGPGTAAPLAPYEARIWLLN